MFSLVLQYSSRCQIKNNILNSVRFAGGGGRPGGKPAFNWKQKMELRLDEKRNQKVIKIRPFGDFEDIESLINVDNGDQIFDLTNMETFVEPIRTTYVSPDANVNKVIDVSSLYGSHKPYGLLQKEYKEKLNKSFKRIKMSKGRPQ